MTHDELLARVDEEFGIITFDENGKGLCNTLEAKGYYALRAVLQIKDRPRYSNTEADMWRSEAWNQALFVVREVIAKELK